MGGRALADDTAPLETECGSGWALARRADGLTTVLATLIGPADSTPVIERARGHNAFGEHSATPLVTVPHPGGTLLLATLVVLTADPAVHGDPYALRTGTRATPTAGGGAEICFPDGTESLVAPLP
ncbi:hypothetical protein [Streptomyces sp. Ag109_O5-1]|uniref:hypothetical protein n=1 Tax=Streptomyces sp. Ag109_O5-1 TaxID=1938851 RepID=UPI000F4EA882|nr:hypothetical protein [Streptomyces sp. Ag109_O5-1]